MVELAGSCSVKKEQYASEVERLVLDTRMREANAQQ